MPYCPSCGKQMEMDENDYNKKEKGLIRWWSDPQGIKRKMELYEKQLPNESNDWCGEFPEHWEEGAEDHSIIFKCECGVEGVGYHPFYGELHCPGDSFAYKFEYLK